MSDTDTTVGDLAMFVAENRSIRYNIYEPSDWPGYSSNIAQVVGCSPNQTDNLLRAVDMLADDHHYVVSAPKLVREASTDQEFRPAQYEVTVSLA
jgi:hypothetical protein